MKKSLFIASIILGILVVGAIVYLLISSNNPSNLNKKITQEFSNELSTLTNNYQEISIKTVTVEDMEDGTLDGYVNLDCGGISYEEKQEFVNDFSNFIFINYPEHLGESATDGSSVRLFCSDSEGESWTITEGMALPDEY